MDSQMNLDKELKIYMQTIRFLDDSTDDYFYLYDLANDRIYFTEKICEKYPIVSRTEGILFSEWSKIVYAKDLKQLKYEINKIVSGKSDSHSMEYRLIDRSGSKNWVICRGTVLKRDDGTPGFLIGNVSEGAVRRELDSLTGLWNGEKFKEDMGCLKKDKGYLMILDIDNFKNINVKNGREFGNNLLKMVAMVLEEKTDYLTKLYRLDGDCFALNFPDKTKEAVIEFYNAVKEELKSYCTASAGAVAYSDGIGEDSGFLHQYAENALDRAKREGKNILAFFSSEDYQKSLDWIKLQDELKESVRHQCKGFSLRYQPQMRGKDFQVYGAEALLRYESATEGLVSPAKFIPILEQSGLICEVGNWVLKTAVKQCADWRKVLTDFHIGVNISYVQLCQDNITEMVLDTIKEAGIPGDALTLEVTESMELQDYSYFNKIFYEWKRHGIHIAIDDFGTGYSSLGYLKSIDVDEIKIDRCFVSRIYCNNYNYRLMSNIIKLAHSSQIQVCCEGVETEEELTSLQQLIPDFLQGFLFAKPYTKEELEKLYMCKESLEYQERVERERKLYQISTIEEKNVTAENERDEIVNIVEGMDEVIYVSDIDTYELYYMNSAARKLTGIYEYKGRKCYQVFQGRQLPCEYCNNCKLKNGKIQVWERDNLFFDKHFVIKDKLIPWNGKMARLEIAMDTDGR